MKFDAVQNDTRDLVAAAVSVSPSGGMALDPVVPASFVVSDIGFSRDYFEQRLSVGDALDSAKPGCIVSVWPPTRGHSIQKVASGSAKVDVVVAVRFEFNPKQLRLLRERYEAAVVLDPAQTAIADANEWMFRVMRAATKGILSDAPDPGGTKFELNEDFFELINFDEGLVAYNVWFNRLCAF